MLTRSIRLAALLPFLQSEPPAGGGGEGNPPTPPTPPADPPLGEKGEKALQDERDARREADRKLKATEKELNNFKTAAAKAKDDEAAEQGEWKQLAEKRDADLQKASTDLTAASTELETLRGYVSGDIEAATKDDAFKPFLRFDPGADAPIADRLKWLKEAKAGIADLPEPATTRGNGPNPKPAGTHKIDEREEVNRIRSRIPQF